LPVVEHIVCADADEAEAAFDRIGVPVVVKGCAANVPHKSEYGLVHLNLKSAAEVRKAAEACLSSLRAMGCAQGQLIVAPMVRGVHEFMLGASVDPVFGPVVMIGEGGTLVEIRRDVVSLLAPFSEEDVTNAIQQLRIFPLFAGYRDKPPMDVSALAKAAVKLGDFAAAHHDRLRSVDMNPVMVMSYDNGVVAVDAIVELL
jgi:succinyl-CoA synthetase beta subunit